MLINMLSHSCNALQGTTVFHSRHTEAIKNHSCPPTPCCCYCCCIVVDVVAIVVVTGQCPGLLVTADDLRPDSRVFESRPRMQINVLVAYHHEELGAEVNSFS